MIDEVRQDDGARAPTELMNSFGGMFSTVKNCAAQSGRFKRGLLVKPIPVRNYCQQAEQQ